MNIEYHATAQDFLSHNSVLLEIDEARYGLILSISNYLIENHHVYGTAAPWFCVVKTGTKTVAAAMRTPPHNVLLAHFSGNPISIAAALSDSILKRREIIPGVVGDKALADAFTEFWCATRGVNIKEKMAQRIYRLEEIKEIKFASGKLRLAPIEDQELVQSWAHGFHHEADPNSPENSIVPKIERGEIYLWEDGGRSVSMAAKTRPTEKGISIGLVYTPPELRQKGYATACVAALCKELLDSGYQFCMLYADLANPTSNSIYQKIGFKPVCDSVEIFFQ